MKRGGITNVRSTPPHAILVGAILSAAFALWAPSTSGQAMATPSFSSADGSRDFLRPPRVRPTPLDDLTADGRPTPAAFAVLRSHARGRVVRIRVGNTRLEVRDAAFDSLGVTFAGEPLAQERLSDQVAAPTDSTGRWSSASPIPWTTIDRLESRRSNLVRGALMGSFLLTLAAVVVKNSADSELGAAGIVLLAAVPPTGAVIGGAVGAAWPRWQHEWPPGR